jgi:hypothetical protein
MQSLVRVSSLFLGSSAALFFVTLWQKLRWVFFTPSNSREWEKEQRVLSTATFDQRGDVTIHNLRDVVYRTEFDFDVHHTSMTFNVSEVRSLWFIQSIFGMGAAHTFFSFELADGRTFAISIEIRKRKGFSFGWKVAFRPVELIYIAATEADVLRTRLCNRDEQVFIYKMNVPKEAAQAVLKAMLKRMNKLAKKPHFYDIVGENCTSLALWHLLKVYPASRLPLWNWRYVVSSRIDELLRARGLIGEPLSLDGKDVCGVAREAFSRELRR